MSIYKYTLGASGAGARGRRAGPPGAGAGRRRRGPPTGPRLQV